MMRGSRLRIVLTGALVLTAAACAKREPEPASTAVAVAEGPGEAAAAVTTTATVEEVDQKTRMVTLLTADGERVRFKADENIRNLPQVRKGDQVRATYYESIAIAVHPAGEGRPGVSVSQEVERAPLGKMPAGVVVRQTTLTAKVTKIDRAKDKVTLEGPQGGSVTLKVENPKNLDGVKVGQLVEATYREAIAISVERPSR